MEFNKPSICSTFLCKRRIALVSIFLFTISASSRDKTHRAPA